MHVIKEVSFPAKSDLSDKSIKHTINFWRIATGLLLEGQ